LLALLAAVAPYELAARLANLLLGVNLNAMAVWRVDQRVGQAAANYSAALSQYHADSRSQGAPVENAPPAVVLGVDGCVLGMQVRTQRRRRVGEQSLPALPAVEKGQFREVKTGVLLLPEERVETSPGRRSLVRRFLVTFEELTLRSLRISRLRSHVFVDFDELIPDIVSLSFQFGLKLFLSRGVPLSPDRGVVFDLVLHHRVKDDRYFVSRRGGGRCGSDFALHPTQVVSQWGGIVMQSKSRHAK